MPASNKARPWTPSRVKSVKFTIGAEVGNAIVVTARLQGEKKNPAALQACRIWLTQTPATLAVAAVAPSGAVAIADSKGVIVVSPTAKLVHDVVTSTAGEVSLSITEAGVATWYLCVQLPDGTVKVSSAITFA